MKNNIFALSSLGRLTLAGILVLTVAGCGHLDLTPPGDADRVLTGFVTYASAQPLPPGAEITVRVMDLSAGEERAEILGEQTIRNPGPSPVAFRIEYRAEDGVLRQRVDLDARISVDGRLRYASTTAHPVTLGNAGESHTVTVETLRHPGRAE